MTYRGPDLGRDIAPGGERLLKQARRQSLRAVLIQAMGAPPEFCIGGGHSLPERPSTRGSVARRPGPCLVMTCPVIPASRRAAQSCRVGRRQYGGAGRGRSRGAGRRRYDGAGRERSCGAGHGQRRNAQPISLPCRCHDAGRGRWDGPDCLGRTLTFSFCSGRARPRGGRWGNCSNNPIITLTKMNSPS